MDLSETDIQRFAGFVRKITKAPNVDSIISDTLETLKQLAGIGRLRVVYSQTPASWTEWKAAADSLEVRPHDEWPEPVKRAVTVFFDQENNHSGFISADQKGRNVRPALEIVAPEVWSALLLQSALTRVQKSAISEAELVRATLRARDEERRHIARELHDDLGQSLASLKLALKWTEDLIRRKPGMTEAVGELTSARSSVGAMLDKVRDLSHTLYPRILDTLGLSTAVKELAHQVSRHSGMKTECSTRGKVRPLGKEVEVALYRCCQEAINNAVRHSEATRLIVLIRFAQREVRVTVEDDGKGFDPRALYDSNSRMMSSGFWTIRQRMADLGAAFRVSTAESQGTVVEMIVPYSSRKAHDRRKNKVTHRG
jgi:signal transduction histidine kinase